VEIIHDCQKIITPTAVALGNFDGLHLGHRRVIAPVVQQSQQAAAQGKTLISTLLSFAPHPHVFFSQKPRPLLTPIEEKIQLLAELGVQQLVVLEFNQELAQLTAAEFINQILVEQLQAQWVSVGFNFHFGYRRQGSPADLQQYWGDQISVMAEQTLSVPSHWLPETAESDSSSLSSSPKSVRISSSNIRAALSEGNIELANTLLGRSYSLTGTVSQGQQLGRTIGFPTANLKIHADKFLPRDGVYAVRVKIGAEPSITCQGVMNIGVRPTVTGEPSRTIEVHLFHWTGDLYGKTLTVELIKFLRPEQKFPSLDALKQQISDDCQTALQILGNLA
jgi:riboflavin kinase/FMN adenylyltransferase